jgi:hypothetical protein
MIYRTTCVLPLSMIPVFPFSVLRPRRLKASLDVRKRGKGSFRKIDVSEILMELRFALAEVLELYS